MPQPHRPLQAPARLAVCRSAPEEQLRQGPEDRTAPSFLLTIPKRGGRPIIPGLKAYNRGDYITAFRTADFCGAVFFRGALFGVGGLRASLTALPAWNRTTLLAAILMVSPVCGFRP
jgi:hypothetical protein